MEVVFMIINCVKYEKRWYRNLWKNELDTERFPRFTYVRILGGSGDIHYDKNNKTLYLPVPDTYEGLNHKVYYALREVVRLFPKVKMIIKVDDDCTCNIEYFNSRYKQLSKLDYFGNYDEIEEGNLCYGPCYGLSRKAIDRVINTPFEKFYTSNCEDVSMGNLLTSQKDIKVSNEYLYTHRFSRFENKDYVAWCDLKIDEKTFVIPYLHGGLGNKLFQIAAALGYANMYHRTLVLSPSLIEIPNYTRGNHLDTIFNKLPRVDITPKEQYTMSNEEYSTYRQIPYMKSDFILRGYFQNEKYFQNCKKEILNLFRPSETMIDNLRFNYIHLDDAYFIHIRTYKIKRVNGEMEDFTSSHLVDLTDYFSKALELIHCENRKIYLLTDNLILAKQIYPFIQKLDYVYVDDSDVNLLYLMSLCRYGGICSNSTFSWWGAYLNESRDKKIIMPRKWLKLDYPCDIYMEGSIVI